MQTHHPLSAPVQAGRTTLDRLGLATEAKVALDAAEHDELAGLIHTAHAPFSANGKRLNPGCTDDAWRQRSIDAQREYIRGCKRFPRVGKVVCHIAPRLWHDETGAVEQTGTYDRLITALAGQADFAAEHGLQIVLENNRAYYPHQMPYAPVTSDGLSENQYFGARPEEWLQIIRDVSRSNCSGCLDTSHACTVAHAFLPEDRAAVMMQYLAEPGLVGHVHWNGNALQDPAGRDDQHLAIDDGDLPIELHRAIAGLDATLHLEHWFDADVLERELAFVASL